MWKRGCSLTLVPRPVVSIALEPGGAWGANCGGGGGGGGSR
jgi:hypothetical protein